MTDKRYRVAVIGATGRGGYGHGLDTAFRDLKQAELCAVADSDEPGRQQATKRLGVTAQFADYREMLDRAKPDIVWWCPNLREKNRGTSEISTQPGWRLPRI